MTTVSVGALFQIISSHRWPKGRNIGGADVLTGARHHLGGCSLPKHPPPVALSLSHIDVVLGDQQILTAYINTVSRFKNQCRGL